MALSCPVREPRRRCYPPSLPRYKKWGRREVVEGRR